MKKFTALLAFLFLLPVCAWSMAQRPPLPETKTPAEEPQLPPLSLEECYELALKQSETIAIKNLDIEKSWSDFLKATGEVIGDGKFVMTDYFIEPQGNNGSADSGATGNAFRPESRAKTFVISQPLFQGLKEVAAVAGAGNLRKQRENEAKRARQLLFNDVSSAFFSVLKSQHDLAINQEILTLYQDRIKDLDEREKIGKSRSSEVATAKSRMKAIEADVSGIRGTLAFQKRLLEFLTGTPLKNRGLVDDQQQLDRPGDLDTYLESVDERADVRAAHHAAKVRFQNIVSTQSAIWPQLSLDANLYEQREGFQSGIDWDLLFTIEVPIWTGGTTAGQIKESIVEWKKSKMNFMESRRKAELDIKQSYEIWDAAVNRYKALQESVAASEENYKLQKDDYQNNLVSNLDVLNALQDFNDARLESNAAFYDLKRDYWQMKVATGDCCEYL